MRETSPRLLFQLAAATSSWRRSERELSARPYAPPTCGIFPHAATLLFVAGNIESVASQKIRRKKTDGMWILFARMNSDRIAAVGKQRGAQFGLVVAVVFVAVAKVSGRLEAGTQLAGE